MGNTIKMNMKMPIYQKKPNVSKSGKFKIFLSLFIGVLIGTSTSFVVNAALIEISLNRFFSLVMNFLFYLQEIVLWNPFYDLGGINYLPNLE